MKEKTPTNIWTNYCFDEKVLKNRINIREFLKEQGQLLIAKTSAKLSYSITIADDVYLLSIKPGCSNVEIKLLSFLLNDDKIICKNLLNKKQFEIKNHKKNKNCLIDKVAEILNCEQTQTIVNVLLLNDFQK